MVQALSLNPAPGPERKTPMKDYTAQAAPASIVACDEHVDETTTRPEAIVLAKKKPKRINPYKMFNGSQVPAWLSVRTEVSPSAKLCYGRLMRYSGKDGCAYPKMATLGTEIGKSQRQVRRLVQELRDHGLIETSDRRKQGLPCEFFFLDHPWIHEKPEEIRTPPKPDELGKKRMSRFEKSCHNTFMEEFPKADFPDAEWKYWRVEENSKAKKLKELAGNEAMATRVWNYICREWMYALSHRWDLHGYPTIGFAVTHCYTMINDLAHLEDMTDPDPDARFYPA